MPDTTVDGRGGRRNTTDRVKSTATGLVVVSASCHGMAARRRFGRIFAQFTGQWCTRSTHDVRATIHGGIACRFAKYSAEQNVAATPFVHALQGIAGP